MEPLRCHRSVHADPVRDVVALLLGIPLDYTVDRARLEAPRFVALLLARSLEYAALLHDMRELVREEVTAVRRLGPVLPSVEKNVSSVREGVRAEIPTQMFSRGSRMDPHT